ncbi:MAG: DUF3034 family protein [Phenylobacterium sp.]|uniref:DUF3034 family protein n=1 Tax=Phenylobacterium sp. TaxID=1871053 RepID=UPI002721C908|nr:DUF3034 family protein [Phenylobacterium sp.]MDO8913480.1 DUF3034 family protein [Phenylobacterium sp.]MDP3101851.1 DUF3034 family protein [Phenylobacterium sp.]MDP3867705.1 DUF3034 family protein [Phenylobacterium sp.]
MTGKTQAVLLALTLAMTATLAQARDRETSGKLLLTGGVTSLEGAGGGGLATWATITGYETVDEVGANAHATLVQLPDYQFRAGGVAVGFRDRVEISYTRQSFDTGDTGSKLGLGQGFTFNQDIVGVKVRVLGDAVYAQDSWVPQVALGVQWKKNDKDAVITAIGGKDDSGVDYYVAATKVLLNQSLVLDGTLRATKANQTGLLGFGGNKNDDYELQFEGSAGYLVSKRLLIGAEYRSKPDNLAGLKEDDWVDIFAAYAFSKNLSVTAAYADLGTIATFKDQRGLYLSIQAGF